MTEQDNNKKIPISVFIVTLNEEKHIRKVLASVEAFDEVVLVDSGSTDQTVEIAQSMGAQVYHQEWLGYAKQKQYAMSLCSNEWVLNLDGDEVLNVNIVNRFADIVENDEADSVRFWRNDLFIGKRLNALSKRPNNHRLYKKSKASFDDSNLAHESAIVEGNELFINEEFDHFGYNSIRDLTEKNNIYSCLKALEKHKKGKRSSLLKLIFIFPITFLKQYLLQRYIFSGTRGFIKSVIVAYYSFLKEAKLYEYQENDKLPPQ